MQENKVEWIVENRLILVKPYHWTIEELTEDAQKIKSLIDQSDQPLVHSLWDFRDLEHYPTKIPAIIPAVKPVLVHERQGWGVTVINNKTISFLSQIAPMVFKVRYKTFEEIDEAKAFLISIDPSLKEHL